MTETVNADPDIAALASPSSGPSLYKSLKRRHESPDNSDSENVDPKLTNAAIKRKRVNDSSDDFVKPSARPAFSLVTKPQTVGSYSTPIQPRRPSSKLTTSTLPSPSPPTAAGRSLVKPKRAGKLSTRRTSSGSFQYTRLDAPSHEKTRAPLSLTAALNGTFTKSKRKDLATIEESLPNKWAFDIYEDSSDGTHRPIYDEELTASFGTQDISDDEGEYGGENKENIPPGEAMVLAPTRHKAIPVSRKNLMTDEPRTPLGDLKASDYYGDGCDATSSILIPADDAAGDVKASDCHATAQCTFTGREDTLLDAASLNALIAGSAPPKPLLQEEERSMNEEAHDGPIEIWESGSAQDEAEVDGDRPEESIFAV
ncbi:MAG: hypothetical protein Q9160_007596 [Pyrenula sp. 1 TL-2023]